ncbi:MAG TPA: phosphoglucosamine mutase [Oscillospiraceae bacterium]|jgi:phosphoglucosamine mutase|nr:phosphoglucosamine mutase [Oscillospiraceae bacterium]HRW56678.1 phosphoglucosamine mutase [Oscillospiraceae bacterium]
MGTLFGTDGVRGIANEKLTPELAMSLAGAAAREAFKIKGKAPAFLVGRDTRISGGMLESAVCAGLASAGADVVRIGVVATPAVAYLVKKLGADAGVMITASHNPFMYNGIKLFNSKGMKFTDPQQDAIEEAVLSDEEPYSRAAGEHIGRLSDDPLAARMYGDYIASAAGRLDGLRLAVDCANGAASRTAEMIFDKKGAEVVYLSREPDGVNVNENCGSLHIEGLSAFVKENGFDLGVAFDGDADRCLAIDENGDLMSGDHILAILADRFDREGRLANRAIVPTIMSNMGLFEFAEKRGLGCDPTKVGDRYVLESMLEHGYSLGGEQSGHVILLDYMPTGDGQLTGLLLAETLVKSGKKASELKSLITIYPQYIVNIHATPEMKERLSDPEVKSYVDIQQERLRSEGRILVRASGTEPLIRIMAEGKNEERISLLVEECARTLTDLLK